MLQLSGLLSILWFLTLTEQSDKDPVYKYPIAFELKTISSTCNKPANNYKQD